MAQGDAQIEVIVSAVDKVTGELKNIESSIQGFSKETKKSTEEVTKSFDDNLGSLIALGNAASTVDNIFSSLTNLQIRLENATLRVTNAQERLEDATTRLTRLQKSGKASADDLADARKEVERATRGVEISENNLARAQNQVIGTYINIGVQTLVLIKSLPTLATAVNGVTISVAGLEIALAPLLIALAALGAIIYVVVSAYKAISESNEKLKTLNEGLAESERKLKDETFGRAEALIKVKEAMDNLINKKSPQENSLEFGKAALENQILLLKEQQKEQGGLETTKFQQLQLLERTLEKTKSALEVERSRKDLAQETVDLLASQEDTENLFDKEMTSAQEVITFISGKYKEEILKTMKEIRDQEIKDSVDKQKELDLELRKRKTIAELIMSAFGGMPGTYRNSFKNEASRNGLN